MSSIRFLPIFIVACRDITSGERGCSVVTSSLLESCSIKPFLDMFALLFKTGTGNLNEDGKKALHGFRNLQPALDLKCSVYVPTFICSKQLNYSEKSRGYQLHNLKISTYKASLKTPLSSKIRENFNFKYTSLPRMESVKTLVY